MALCPICINKEATVFTECNHSYCACCISRIKKCSICRKPLLHNELCNEIKHWYIKKNFLLPKKSNSSRLEINLRPEDLQLIGLENFSLSNIIQSSYNNQSNYSFYIPPENHRPSGTGGGSRVTN